MTQPKAPGFDPQWLEPGEFVPVNVNTTAALITEVKLLRIDLTLITERLEVVAKEENRLRAELDFHHKASALYASDCSEEIRCLREALQEIRDWGNYDGVGAAMATFARNALAKTAKEEE